MNITDIFNKKGEIMINKIEAFNNRNNYRQNFGMAVGYADETTRTAMKAIGKKWGEPGTKLVQKTIREIKTVRAADEGVDIVFFDASGSKVPIVDADIFDKKTGNNIARGIKISADITPEEAVSRLYDLNRRASNLEREMQGNDVFIGIPKIQCAQSKK